MNVGDKTVSRAEKFSRKFKKIFFYFPKYMWSQKKVFTKILLNFSEYIVWSPKNKDLHRFLPPITKNIISIARSFRASFRVGNFFFQICQNIFKFTRITSKRRAVTPLPPFFYAYAGYVHSAPPPPLNPPLKLLYNILQCVKQRIF